ncbi:MAG: type I glutamate--ammonia ligase [Candidatus Diapherotrites archaeon]|uniref:Glutamine synthetase n=1 Tax=Candidatus Iainarchaeum sp. TaxID=3101447 RepID=A0A8T3YK55_9ARCH|nr:type I glutamate--ammonia ligase [Candidatus Diapherotrites archaeon]
MDKSQILDTVKKHSVELAEMQFSDIDGMIKSVTIPHHKIEEALERGVWFDGSSIEGFTRISESDMFLKPDADTFSIIPWRSNNGHKTARIICDVYTPNGRPFDGDPRIILKRAVEKAAEMGFTYYTGPEVEFFLFRPEENGKIVAAPHDVGGYFDFAPKDHASDVRRDIIMSLESLGLEVEASHHEVAYGQHEIDFRYSEAVKSADNVLTFKYTTKAIAQSHNLYASFMPKPIFGINGSGMHVHQSLFKGGKNAFFDAKGKYSLSETARHFIAGQLKHAKALAAVVAPTVNSYKRLVPGYEAPVYISWGQTNRSALIRIPHYSPGRESSTRAELRCPDPSCNPYLAFATMLCAGIDGIKHKLEPPEPMEESLYELGKEEKEKLGIDSLPSTLLEAIAEMKKDKVVVEALGPWSSKHLIEAKSTEYDEYRIQVTKWEIEKYLETI